MGKTNSELGKEVQEHLIKLGLETLINPPDIQAAAGELSYGVDAFLTHMGLDVKGDDSICDTPNRVAEMFTEELCYGLDYSNFPKCTVTTNGKEVFDEEGYDKEIRRADGIIPLTPSREKDLRARFTKTIGAANEMVMVRNINTVSLCEHHFQTISGRTYIAYIPGAKLLGLSKFARVTDFFARRPQVQERMTEQIYAALSFILQTEDIAVYQACEHNCMKARGAMDPHSDTITSKMGGRFMSNPSLRQEFLDAIK